MGAKAVDNLRTLEGFRMTAPVEWPTIPQTGARADAIKEILKKITLPLGFHIGLYAIVPDARHMAVGPQGVVIFVGTRKNKIWAVTDRDRSGGARRRAEAAAAWRLAEPTAAQRRAPAVAVRRRRGLFGGLRLLGRGRGVLRQRGFRRNIDNPARRLVRVRRRQINNRKRSDVKRADD
jgi:hypothetical protein